MVSDMDWNRCPLSSESADIAAGTKLLPEEQKLLLEAQAKG
jgi:hypothetical protein